MAFKVEFRVTIKVGAVKGVTGIFSKTGFAPGSGARGQLARALVSGPIWDGGRRKPKNTLWRRIKTPAPRRKA
jgi:hypothetical protein